MIRNLRNIFGDEFWENTIVEITHYAFDNNARNKRKYVYCKQLGNLIGSQLRPRESNS
jgi:hypothetical protein